MGKADMMFSNEKYPYIPLKELKAEAIQIPYKGQRLSMILLLPRPDSSLEELEKSLEKVPDINTVLKFPPLPGKSKVELSLPKFKLETQLDLNDNLKAMGITDMFDENKADFSKMRSGGKRIYMSQKLCKKPLLKSMKMELRQLLLLLVL